MTNVYCSNLHCSDFFRYLPHGSGCVAIIFIPVFTFALDLNHFFEFTTVGTFNHENETATNNLSANTVPTDLR